MKILAYNPQDLIHQSIQKLAKLWHKSSFISLTQLDKINDSYPHSLQTPNIFIRILLFVFTLIATSFGAGIFGTVFVPLFPWDSLLAVIFFSLAIACVSYFLLTHFIKEKKQYQAGVDDACLYIFIASIGTVLGIILSKFQLNFSQGILIFIVFFLPILFLLGIRYVDKVSTTLTYITMMYAVFLIHVDYLPYGTLYLPFSSMICAACMYWIIKKYAAIDQFQIWSQNFLFIEILCLVQFYLSGNYFVVKTLSEVLLNMHLAPNEDISLAYFFYAFTFLMPAMYLYFSIIKRDVTLLRISLVLIVGAVITFEYYFSTASIEVFLTATGALLLFLAILLFRFLKNKPQGFTSELILKNSQIAKMIEKASILQSIGADSQIDVHDSNLNQGGQFGGGGANGNFE